jgi:hypothetical protein
MDRQWLYFGLLCGRGTGDAGWPGIAHTAGIDPSPYGGHTIKPSFKLVYTYTQLLYWHTKYTIDMKKLHTSITIIVLTLNLDFVQVIFQNFIKHSQNSLSACHFYAKIVSNFY